MLFQRFFLPVLLFILLPSTAANGFLTFQSQASDLQFNLQVLEQGKTVEREIKGGEEHSYQVTLSAGQFLRAVVEQNGIELYVTLYGPANNQLIDIRGWQRYIGTVPIYWMAEQTGSYSIRVCSSNKAAAGRYKIRVEEIRAGNDEDRVRVSAQAAHVEASRFFSEPSKESKEKAIEKYLDALSKFKLVSDQYAQGYTLRLIGDVYFDLEENQKALDYYSQALALHKQVGDRSGEAVALNNIGLVYNNLGENQKTLDYYSQALPLHRQLGDRSNEATTLNNIGSIYNNLGERQKALDYHNQALVLHRQLGNRSGEANTLTNIGFVYNNLGENQKALDYYSQALALHRQLGNRSGEANTLNNIGFVYKNLGERQKALDYYSQALQLRRQLGTRTGEATSLNNIGRVYDDLGEKQKALDYFNQALQLYRQVGDRSSEALLLNNIGLVYKNLGENQKALDYYNQAFGLYKQLGDRFGESISLNNIGRVYDDLGEKQKALDYHNQALVLRRQLGNRGNEAITLNNIGRVYYDLGEKQKALDYYNQALVLFKQVGDRSSEATTLNNIGRAYYDLGEKQKAFDYYGQALALHRQVGNRDREAIVLLNISKLESEQNNLTSARTNIENAIKNVEFIRSNVAGQQLRSSFFQTKRDYYELYIEILMRLHKANPKDGFDSLALQASERSRARSLVDLLSEANIDIREGVDAKLLEREKGLRQIINDKTDLLLKLKNRKSTAEQVAQAEKEIDGLISEYREVENRIRASSPKYAALTQPEAISLKDIQQLLDTDTLLLEYSLGNDCSYLWLVSQASLIGYELPARNQIEDKAKEFYKLLISPASGGQTSGDYQKAAFELGKTLLGPVEAELGKKRLLVVAEGALQYIPFSALSLQTSIYSPLILDHEIANIPSLSTLAVQRREHANRPAARRLLAVIADPVFEQDDSRVKQSLAQRKITEQSSSTELKQTALLRSAEDIETLRDGGFARLLGSRKEANAIATLAQKEQVLKALDFDASREIATSEELSKYRYIHIATHGLLNSKNPELSGVVLSLVDKDGKQQSGFLKLNEIYNLKLNAELVVLSGCQTGLGKEIKGEGLVGLTRGFMYAGAKSVVASLWSVQDFTTSELMTSFYQAMLKGGKRPAEALRQAQIEMFKKARKSNPYYWAGFTFQGDWR